MCEIAFLKVSSELDNVLSLGSLWSFTGVLLVLDVCFKLLHILGVNVLNNNLFLINSYDLLGVYFASNNHRYHLTSHTSDLAVLLHA